MQQTKEYLEKLEKELKVLQDGYDKADANHPDRQIRIMRQISQTNELIRQLKRILGV